ncbi:ermin-like [Astyanax mexicanus]|uniref:Ermin n=1 Tax=Astyanax mexicanus TaxID=7994 RepID=A0A8T2M0T8_ASTMX|nr:ermin-like [Astyanax mexicanus]
MDLRSHCTAQETMADHQTLPPPLPSQPADHTPESETPSGSQKHPQSSSNQALAPVGQEGTSAQMLGGDTDSGGGDGDPPNDDTEQIMEEEETYITTAENADGENETGQEEEGGEREEEEEDEKDGLDGLQPEKYTQNFPQTSQRSGMGRGRSKGRGSRSGPPMSKYNTVSYRRIKRGNTQQRVDEFEFMMSV